MVVAAWWRRTRPSASRGEGERAHHRHGAKVIVLVDHHRHGAKVIVLVDHGGDLCRSVSADSGDSPARPGEVII